MFWDDLVNYHKEPKTAMGKGQQMTFSSSDGENGSALGQKKQMSLFLANNFAVKLKYTVNLEKVSI